MQDPGYQWVPVHDPSAGHGLEVAQQNGQYRMKFRASDDVAITIDVHIRISGNVTGFYYHDAGTDAPDVSSQSRYQKLRERMALEFGADNVSEGHSFLPPECKTSGVGNMPAAGPAILKHVAGKH